MIVVHVLLRELTYLIVPVSENHRWKELFGEAYTYICTILEEDNGNEKDVDVIKRAKGIIAREKMLKIEYRQTNVEEVTEAVKDANLKDPDHTDLVTKIDTTKEEGSTTDESVASVEESVSTSENLAVVPEESVVGTDQAAVSSTEDEGKQPNQPTTPKSKKKSKKNKK